MAAVDHRAPTAGARRAGPWRLLAIFAAGPLNLFVRKRPQDIGLLPDGESKALSGGGQRRRTSSMPPGPPKNGRSRAPSAPADSGGSCSVTSAPSSPGMPCRCTRRSTLIETGFTPLVAAWALGIVSVVGHSRPDQPRRIVGPHRPRVGVDGGMRRVCNLLRGTDRTRVLAHHPPALPDGDQPGLSWLRAHVSHGPHRGRDFRRAALWAIFGTITVALLGGGAAGPWMAGIIHDATGSYQPAFVLAIACCVVSAAAIWIAAPRKVRLVPGRVPRASGLAGKGR